MEHVSEKKRILFVDDEAALLTGLKNVLRPDRVRWDMVFTSSVDSAIAELERAPFHAVVSDLRMPVKNGIVLFDYVKARHPSVVRIMLSGSTDGVELLRAMEVADTVLTKPCGIATLRQCIDRCTGGDLHKITSG